MEQRQRLAFTDRAKGIGILMVVFSHLSSMTGFGNHLWTWYNPFMLTLFFVISGMMRRYRDSRMARKNGPEQDSLTAGTSGREALPDFLRRRARALLLPYFVFDILALGIQTVLAYWRGGVPEAVLRLRTGGIRILTFQGLGPDWFLPALFLAELLLDLALRAGGESVSAFREKLKSGGSGPQQSGGSGPQQSGGTTARTMPAAPGHPSSGQGLSLAMAALFAVSVFTVFCLGGDRMAILGPFRFVIVKGLAAAGFLVMGYVLASELPRLLVSDLTRLLIAAGISLAGTLLIAGRYNLDFNQLDFGSRPLLLYADTLCGTCFVLCVSRIPDLLSGMKAAPDLLQVFGRESLTIMCTHLEWQIVPIIHLGFAAVAPLAGQEGKRFYAEMLIRLCLVMAVELGLIPVLHSLMPWLYRKKKA